MTKTCLILEAAPPATTAGPDVEALGSAEVAGFGGATLAGFGGAGAAAAAESGTDARAAAMPTTGRTRIARERRVICAPRRRPRPACGRHHRLTPSPHNRYKP